MKNCMRIAKRTTAILLVLVMWVTLLPVLPVKAADETSIKVRPNYRIAGQFLLPLSPIPRPESSGDRLCKETGLYYNVLLDIQVDTTTNKATISLDRDLHDNKEELYKFINYLADNYPNLAPTNYSAEILTSAYNKTSPILQKNTHGELTADVETEINSTYGYFYITLKNMAWETEPFKWYLDEEGKSYHDIEAGEGKTSLRLSSRIINNDLSNGWTASFSNGGPSNAFTLSTKTFEMGVDNFNFLNAINSFYFKGYRYSKDKPAFRTTAWTSMSHKYFDMLLKDVDPSMKAFLISMCDSEFEGYCAGMASVAGLIYTDELKVSQFETETDVKKTYDLKPARLNQTLQDAIVYYHLAHNARITNRKFMRGTQTDKQYGLELLGVLKEKLPDSPVLLSLNDWQSGHAILAYSYENTSNGYTYIYFYDPNKKSRDWLKIHDDGTIEFTTNSLKEYKVYGYASMDEAYKTVAEFKDTLKPIDFSLVNKTALVRVKGTDKITIFSGAPYTGGKSAQFADGALRGGDLDAEILGYTNPLNVKPIECYFLVHYEDGHYVTVQVDDDSNASVEIIMNYGEGNMTVFAEDVNTGTTVGINTADGKRTAEVKNESDETFRISVVDDITTNCGENAVAVEGNGKGVALTPDSDGMEIETPDGKDIDIITTDISKVPDPENAEEGTTVYKGVTPEETEVIVEGITKKRYVVVYKGNNDGSKLLKKNGTEINKTPEKPEPPKEYNVCCIKYDGNGATSGSMSDQYFLLYDGSVLKKNSYVKTGYHLKEWNTEADESGDPYEAESEAAAVMKGTEGTVTLYAQWEKNTFIVSYDGNGADNTDEVMEDQNFVYGEKQLLRKNIYSREGFLFAGWTKYETPADSVTPYDDESDGSMVTTTHKDSITLYAKWVANHQHVAAGTWSKDADYHWHECTVYTNCTKLDKEKHAYGNWVIDKAATVSAQGSKHRDCTVCGYRVTETIPKLDSDAKQYTIVYDGNGATSGTMDDQLMTYGAGTLLTENAFEKTGYKFAGWNTKKDGSGTAYEDKADGSSLISGTEETITLYAQWTVESTGGGNNGGSSGDDNGGGTSGDNGGSGGSDGDNGGGSSSGGGAGNTGNGGNNGGNVGDTGNTGDTGNSGNTGAEDSKPVNNTKPVASNDGSKVTTTSKGEATVTEVKKTNSKSITVSSTTMVDGVKYNVTTINAYAFKNATKAKTVTLPNTITKIKANAFASSKIEIVKLTIKKGGKLTIDKKAFKKSRVKKVQVTMNKKATKKEKDAVIKALKKAGISKKNIKIKLK